MNLSSLVKDWGGFERLVAELNKTGEVSVQHNAVLTGKSGAGRQVDVLIRHRQGLYEHLIVAECKYWNKAVDRATVDSLATTVREVGASRGVIFSRKGFQSGAITQAASENIALFVVRDLTDEEWGLPGRIVDLFVHVIAVSVGDISLDNAFTVPHMAPTSPHVDLHLGNPETITRTPIKWEGSSATTLEEGIEKAAHQAAQKTYWGTPYSFDGGSDGKLRARISVNIAPPKPIYAQVNGGVIWIPSATLDIGISVSQSRLVIDRGKNLHFALAVEDCVRRTVTAASRHVADTSTILTPLTERESASVDEPVKNGSVLSVWVAGVHSFDEFRGLEPGQWELSPPT